MSINSEWNPYPNTKQYYCDFFDFLEYFNLDLID